MNDITVAELAAQNGRMGAVGTSGLEVYYGQVEKADNSKLWWPTCFPLFQKLLRRDPQVAQWRVVATAMASKVDWFWELPQEDPTATDEAFLEFLHTIWDDLPGGQRRLIDTYISYILMGWCWFENVPGRRNGQQQGDWTSVYDDGLVGLSDIAFRDHSSFLKWDIDESTGKLRAFVQYDPPNKEIPIPLARSTHITLGDPTSPEGLSPFEALWRLENFMYNLEIVFGIGSEHAAGHAKFQSTTKLTAEDNANIRAAAQALLAAQEGNYISLPEHITAEIIDVAFSAGSTILEGIKLYSHLKLQVLNMQWMALSLTGDAGSNASMFTSANMWLTAFNAQMNGAARVVGEQIATQLRGYNKAQFGSVKRMPVLKATPIEANIDLLELVQFATGMSSVLDWTEADKAAFRRKSNFLPEIDVAEIVEDEPMADEPDDEGQPVPEPDEDEVAVDEVAGEFAQPIAIGKNQPTVTTAEDLLDLDDPGDLARIERMLKRFDEENDSFLADLFGAKEADEE